MNGSRRKNQPGSPGKRWQTTTNAALEDVAAKMEGSYNRSAMLQENERRKMANTKTSINFGNEKVAYISDARENQIRCSGSQSVEERQAQAQRIKTMKAELTTTNFRLGDEKPTYESANHQAMKAAESYYGVGRVGVNNDLKEAVKRSSIHFGNERVDYTSTAHDSMKYNGNENNFSALKEEVRVMTEGLRKHNFSLGDEKVSYQSDYASGYGSLPLEAYKVSGNKKAAMRGVIEDSRSCHFSLGQDKIQYQSNTQQALNSINGHSANDVAAQAARVKQMKTALQRTSIVIGDDVDYY